MKYTVWIFSGPSGCGKTSFAKELVERVPNTSIISADDFFKVDDSSFAYDRSKIDLAHVDCFSRFLLALQEEKNIIVDNTNATAWEISPYIMASKVFGFEHLLMRFRTTKTPEELASLNLHGVSARHIEGQMRALSMLQTPKHWNVYDKVL